MIREVRDPAIINRFAAHPEIAPLVGGPIDFTNAMRETAVFLFGEHGGFIFEWCAPGTYEVHVMLTKAGRGRWGFTASKSALAMMGDRGAEHIWGRIRTREVGHFAAAAGFQDAGWQTFYTPEPERLRVMNWRNPCLQR